MVGHVATSPSPPSPAAPPAPPLEDPADSTPSAPHDDSPACRICLDGPDELLGRLSVPCRCTGTARFVRAYCLDSWRNSDAAGS
ncbi:hypothetical protein JCM10213_005352 [Rhodosporidiobolus nylandii]